MRDYLGSEVAGAMDLIRALAPPPAPAAPQPALGQKPMGRKGGGMLKGPGDGRSDSIPAALGDGAPVKVSDGEYVIPADVVSALGRGSSDAGSRQLTDMVLGVREGYQQHLGKLGKPAKSRGDKALGGFFGSEQESEIVLPKYVNEIGGRNAQLLKGVWESRLPGEDVAGFTPDQIAAMDAGRGIATGDPYGVDQAFNDARGVVQGNQQYFDAGQGNLAAQQGVVSGAQQSLGRQSGYLDGAQGMLGKASSMLDGQTGFLNQGQGELGKASSRIDQQYGKLDQAGNELTRASGRIDAQYGNLDRAQSGLNTQRGQIGGAQNYLQDVLGPGGDNQALIDASLGSFDYQRAKDVASAQRLRAGRKAFGERRAIAEDEESVASNIGRANLEAGLRDAAISRRMEAASGIGNLAQTGTGIENAAGNLTGQAGQLAGTQGQMASARGQLAGQAGDLAGTQGQLATGRGTLTNAAGNLAGTQANIAGTSGSLVNSATGVANSIGGLADTSGSLTSRSGVLSGQNIDAAQTGANLATGQRGVGVSNVGLLSGIGEQQQTQNQAVLNAPYNRVAQGNAFRSGAPSAVNTTSSPGLGQVLLAAGAIGGGILQSNASQAGAAAGAAKDGGRLKDVRKGYALGGEIDYRASNSDFVAGEDMSPVQANMARRRHIREAAAAKPEPALGSGANGSDGVGAGGVLGDPKKRLSGMLMEQKLADGGEVQSYYDIARMGIMSPMEALRKRQEEEMAPIQPLARNQEFNQRLDEFRGAPGDGTMLGSVGDALGLNYMGPDEDGNGGMPNTFERRAMKDRTAPPAPAPERFPAQVAEKPPLADRVGAILAKGAPTRAPMASPPVPATRPMQAPAPAPMQAASLGSPEAEWGRGARAPQQQEAALGAKPAPPDRSWGDRVGDAFTNPLTQFGLALLADDGRNGFAGAIGKAGLSASQAVASRRRDEAEAARQAKKDALEEQQMAVALRKAGLSEQQAAAYIENQRALQADREADNARQAAKDAEDIRLREAGLGIQRDNAANLQAYRGKTLGIQQANLDRLREQGKATTGGKPTNTVVLQGLREKLAGAIADQDQEGADYLRSQIAALEMNGADDGMGDLPPGFELDGSELRDGGMVKKKRKC